MTMHKRTSVIILLLLPVWAGWFGSCQRRQADTLPELHLYCDNIVWQHKSPCLLLTGNDTLSGKIKFRGGISSRYGKHSFTLKLGNAYPLEGLPAARTFILNANYIDKTMMRHKLSYDLFRKMRPCENKAAECRYVQLHLNGRYEGLYVLMEKLDAKRLGLDKHDSMSMIFKDPPIFWGENRIVPQDSDNYYQQTYPKITEEDKTAYLEQFMHFLFEAPDTLFAKEIGCWVDLDNVTDWHLLLLLTNNEDGLMKNFFLYKCSASEPFRFAPWDYDHSFGRDGDNEMNMLERIIDCDRCVLLRRLHQIPSLQYDRKLAARWRALREKGVFSLSGIREMVEENHQAIEGAVMRNAEKWPWDADDYYDDSTYTQEVQLMLSYLQKRLPQLDSCFHYRPERQESKGGGNKK